jgi:two-component system sensor kinase FixL
MPWVEALSNPQDFAALHPQSGRVVERTHIQLVLINLMRNAAAAMVESGRRGGEVRTSRLDDEVVEIAVVEIAVADSGPGLSREVANHLLEPFISTKRIGMGLGPSICRSIVESHGGKLWTRPDLGGGATFRFIQAALPLEGASRAF